MKNKKIPIALIMGILFTGGLAQAEDAAVVPSAAAPAKSENEFIYRVSMGRADDVKLTLQAGDVNPRQTNRDGLPAIVIAASRTDDQGLPIVMVLLAAGAGVNDCDNKNHCPLLAAIKAGNTDTVRYLLDAGADTSIRDEAGRTAVEVAAQQSKSQIADMLSAAAKKQADELAMMKRPEYLTALIGRFAYVQCASQYATYFLTSEQGTEEENRRFKLFREQYVQLGQKYFSQLERLGGTPASQLVNVARAAKKEIYQQLSEMVSNRERKAQGVGTEADLLKRCGAIASHWNIQPAGGASSDKPKAP